LLPPSYTPRVIYFGGDSPATNTTVIIDLSAATPVWTPGPSMSSGRIQMNAVLLPNGKVLASGGSLNDEDIGSASLAADLFDPATETWSSAGVAAYARLYHSNALLLPDATVAIVGSNPQRGTYEPHIEIWTPPYLFTTDGSGSVIPATRPTISAAPASIGYAGSFAVQSPDAANIGSIVLMRPGSPTHAFDMEQRLVGLSFSVSGSTLTVSGPPDARIAPPGYYMLFLLNTQGVPSRASFVQVSPTSGNQPPTGTITQPAGDVTIQAGQSVTFAGSGSDPDGAVARFAWIFPDGGPNASTAQNPGPVTFSTAGTHVVSLTVVDTLGDNDPSPPTRTVTVTAANQPPTAKPGGPYSGTTGQPIQFNGSASSDPDGTITAYAWTFGDGGTATGATPTHTYATAGGYTVALTVTDNSGASSSANTSATVSAPGSLPAAPTGLTASLPARTTIGLAWTDQSNNESGFKIERSTDGQNFTQIATVGAGVTTFTNSGLRRRTRYFYRVRAFNSAGDSAYSNTVFMDTR
jgi:PKD repeat protein